jgi:hypothetical protein
MRHQTIVSVLVFFLVVPLAARADMPGGGPRPRPPRISAPTGMTIEVQDGAREATLFIPRDLFESMQANNGTAQTSGFATILTPAIILSVFAGLLLSAAFGVAGIWFVWSRKLKNRSIGTVLLLACALAGAMTTATLANGPPPTHPHIAAGSLNLAASSGQPLSGQVRVQVDPYIREIKLVLPPATTQDK